MAEETPAETIVLSGSQAELKTAIMQTLALKQLLDANGQGSYYSIPITTFQDQFRFAPQVRMLFLQTKIEEAEESKRISAEIAFKIAGETEKTMTEAKALPIAQAIKREFVTGTLFKINKGTTIVTYLDKAKGYDFRLRVTGEAEAKRVINKVLDIQNHSPEWERLVIHESKASFPAIPSRELIYGENRRPPRRRPSGIVPFRYAEMHIWGLEKPVTLVDLTNRPGRRLVEA